MSASKDSARVMEMAAGLSSRSSFESLQEIQNFLFEQGIRDPALEVRCGKLLIENHKGRLGDRVWDMYERIFIAALDAHDTAARKEALKALTARFPGSNRIKKLRAMAREAFGEFAQASASYEQLIKGDPANTDLYKRQICILKAQGETEKAIIKLNQYLKTFSNDENAWNELSDLYIASGRYNLAKFAQEELLLMSPDNYLYHLQHAETLYTLKSFNEARAHYAQALELRPENNLRGMYGLMQCLRAKGGKGSLASELHTWAVDNVLKEYRAALGPEAKGLTPENVLVEEDSLKVLRLGPNPHLHQMLTASLQL